MRGESIFTPAQEATFEQLMRPDSNWPEDLRQTFEQRRAQVDGFKPDLDEEVVADYVQQVIK